MNGLIQTILEKTPYIRTLLYQIKKQGEFPAGHYYSPVPDREEVLEYFRNRKPVDLEIPDIPMNRELQLELLDEYAAFYHELPFPEKQNMDYRYYYDNGFFRYSDAIFLYGFLRKHQPKKIIEIGSGFSSAVMLDTIDGFFSEHPEITFIEPYPDRLKSLLRNHDEKTVKIIDKKVQEVPLEIFPALEEGDFLFIDSSHVMKCGSDLQMLLFEILPILPPGIFVHFHDIFFPFEYPSEWLQKGFYWNENYFLRAFLSGNHDWSVYFFNTYVALAFDDLITQKMPLCKKDSGGSLYIKRERVG